MANPVDAEQAAAEAIKGAFINANWRMPDDFEEESRAVVAAVRPVIAAEELFDAARAITDRAAERYRGTDRNSVEAAVEMAALNEAAAIVRGLAEQHRAAAAARP